MSTVNVKQISSTIKLQENSVQHETLWYLRRDEDVKMDGSYCSVIEGKRRYKCFERSIYRLKVLIQKLDNMRK